MSIFPVWLGGQFASQPRLLKIVAITQCFEFS